MAKKRHLKNPGNTPKPRRVIIEKAHEHPPDLRIDHLHAPDLMDVLGRLPSIHPQFKLKIVPDFELPRADARAYCKAWILKIRESTVNAVERYGNGRARFTLAHELGHLFLGHPRSLDRKRPDQEIAPADRLLEEEANAFAAEFLAPGHLISPEQTADDIGSLFQISFEAAARRSYEFGGEENTTSEKRRAQADRQEQFVSPNDSAKNKAESLFSSVTAKPLVFVSMAFTPEMNCLYREVLKPTIEDMGMASQRADEKQIAETIVYDIRRSICSSKLVVADISGLNLNVFHEIGLAQSIDKPTIIICRHGYREEQIPSNIRHIRRIIYPNHAGGGPVLRRELEQTFESIISCWRTAAEA